MPLANLRQFQWIPAKFLSRKRSRNGRSLLCPTFQVRQPILMKNNSDVIFGPFLWDRAEENARYKSVRMVCHCCQKKRWTNLINRDELIWRDELIYETSTLKTPRPQEIDTPTATCKPQTPLSIEGRIATGDSQTILIRYVIAAVWRYHQTRVCRIPLMSLVS